MISVGRPVEYWTYDHETTAKIIATVQEVGAGACLRFTPYINGQGEPALDWSVITDGQVDGGDPPGGNDSHVCPPIC